MRIVIGALEDWDNSTPSFLKMRKAWGKGLVSSGGLGMTAPKDIINKPEWTWVFYLSKSLGKGGGGNDIGTRDGGIYKKHREERR